MASEERKAADNKIKEQNFQKSLGAGEQAAETDAFQCGRCKQVRRNTQFEKWREEADSRLQRKCRYRQAQTRSADEPMTVRSLPFLRPFSQILIVIHLDVRHVRILSVSFLFASY